MNMSTKKNVITTSLSNDDVIGKAKRLAIAQWNGLRELESKFNNIKVPQTINLFKDSNWFEESNDDYWESANNLNWSNFYDLKHQARLFLCKYVAYKDITERGISPSTVRGKLIAFNLFFNHLNRKEILTSDNNTSLLGLNVLTREDIEEYIDTYLATGITSKTGSLAATAITDLRNYSYNFKDTLPFLHMGNILPWELDEKSPTAWINQRMTDLGIVNKDVEPYRPFSTTTSKELVEHSMDILDNYAELALELISEGSLFGHTRSDGTPQHRFSTSQRRQHAKNYNDIFDSIVPMELEESTGYVKQAFYGKLFRIIQGAMLNIIFFTTGIRNSDARNLIIGCCVPSDVEDYLYYITTGLQKTGNDIHIPVPEQTYRAIKILEKMRFGDNNYAIARYAITIPRKSRDNKLQSEKTTYDDYVNAYNMNLTGSMVNSLLKGFASHFNIPFIDDDGNPDNEATAHRYRATTAGWLASASNLSVLLVRRLFGHTNYLMPLSYLHHNPNFITALDDITEEAHNEVASKLTKAVADKKIGGAKGKQLLTGFEYQKGKSQSLSEAQLMVNFQEQLKERLDSGQLCGFITPLAVVCGRNPNDTTPTPCATKSYKNHIAERAIDKELLEHMSMIRPDQCIGNKCEEAIIGEWSTSLRDSFIWYAKLLKGLHGDKFTEEHYIKEAKSFIRQYANDMKSVFDLEAEDVE